MTENNKYQFGDYRKFQEIEIAVKRIAAGAETLEKMCSQRLLKILLEKALNNGLDNARVKNILIEYPGK